MKPLSQRSPASIALLIAWGMVGLYTFGYWFRLLDSPLVLAPQLDSAELISLARAIVGGALAPEPFYRAMGYPLVLSGLVALGVESAAALGIAAVTLGAGLHLLNTALVASLAQRLWRTETVRPLAVFLFGFNPVVLFFSLDVLDIALGLSCALGAFWWLTSSEIKRPFAPYLAGAFLLGLACFVRPHFLFLVPVGLLVCLWRPKGKRRIAVGSLAALVLALPLLLQAAWGWRLSGQWELLPWQGAFNLYAANAPDANGKYFTQSVVVRNRPEGKNPARLESEFRYGEATGEEPPYEVGAMSRFWRQQFREELVSDPLDWLHLIGRKAYYLFNDFEQYNNKTFAFFRVERPILRWNPLSWGVLLVVACGVVLVGFRERPRGLGLLLVSAGFYAVGLLAFYVSGRFRMPLHAVLVIGAAGLPAVVPTLSVVRIRVAAIGMALIGILTFSRFFEADSTATFVQDRMLLANAATTVGEDALAWKLSGEVASENPDRRDATDLALVSFFNLKAEGDERPWVEAAALFATRSPEDPSSPEVAFANGVIAWNLGEHEEAEDWWKNGVEQFGTRALRCREALDWVNGTLRSDAPLRPAYESILPLPETKEEG